MDFGWPGGDSTSKVLELPLGAWCISYTIIRYIEVLESNVFASETNINHGELHTTFEIVNIRR